MVGGGGGTRVTADLCGFRFVLVAVLVSASETFLSAEFFALEVLLDVVSDTTDLEPLFDCVFAVLEESIGVGYCTKFVVCVETEVFDVALLFVLLELVSEAFAVVTTFDVVDTLGVGNGFFTSVATFACVAFV